MNEQHNKVVDKIRELSAAADNIEGAGVLVIACFDESDDQIRTTVAASGSCVMIAEGIAEALTDPNTSQVAELIHKSAKLAALNAQPTASNYSKRQRLTSTTRTRRTTTSKQPAQRIPGDAKCIKL